VVTAAIWAGSLVTWWVLADPKWGIFGNSQPAVGAVLFWVILAFIFTGFTFGGWPFSGLRQPIAGLAQVTVNLALGGLAVWLFTYVIGSWDPTFSHAAEDGVGFTAAAFVVLIGFYAYALVAASWGGYPFERLPQPSSGAGQFFLGAFLTTAGVVVLIYPNFSAALAKHAPLALPTALGWVYCSIVVVILAAMLWENWPSAAVGNRHLRALTAAAVSLLGGIVVFYAFRAIVQVVAPPDIRSLSTFSLDSEAAQLGVCFSLWALTWGLVWGAPPTRLRSVSNRVLRTLIVGTLAVATYAVFMHFLGTQVLHFPAVKGRYGGNPLIWIDWVVLVLLWYAVAFGGIGSTRRIRSA
jgi:AAT family amino acid transporter